MAFMKIHLDLSEGRLYGLATFIAGLKGIYIRMENEDFSIPDDFPRPVHSGAVGGFQDKLLLAKFDGKFYAPGCTPREIFERWDICEDLAQQFAQKSLESKAGKRADLMEVEILDQYCVRAMKMSWGSHAEMKWVFRRVAAILAWPVPPSALAEDA